MSGAKLLAACVCVVGFAPPAKHLRAPTRLQSTIQYPKNPLESVLSLGAPRFQPPNGTYVTAGGVGVTRASYTVEDAHGATEALVDALDDRRGVLMHSSYEFPGRYARWTVGFSDPPVLLSGRARDFALSALNDRGRKILQMLEGHLRDDDAVASLEEEDNYARLVGRIRDSDPSQIRREEERSKEPSLMSVVRNVVQTLYHPDDPQLGLYGALGYDLMFQFEPINPSLSRKEQQRDVALFIPDEILVVDTREQQAWTIQYDFTWCVAGEEETVSTVDMARSGTTRSHEEGTPVQDRDVEPGGYASLTERSKQEFACGNLFEVVLSQQWSVPAEAKPSAVFRTLRKRNPSPYGFLMNLRGEDDSSVPWISGYDKGEYLVGASPEMFVRVERIEGKMRVETCPISGTIERGADALEDAVQVRTLLGSKKDESELTMCTDVDRNDKSRICAPGSVKVIGRRQIEMYSKLIHTVDHVEGYLREGFDALDAFLCHTWAVTVTGAPKAWAARFIEKHERSARAWYGGAVGHVAFDGSLNTGLTLRTIHYADGVASVRAGATLLYDSDPIAEEAETELKASARLRRPVAFLRSYAIEATRLHLTMKWVVSFLILSTFRARSRLDIYVTHRPCSARCGRRRPVNLQHLLSQLWRVLIPKKRAWASEFY
jgi:anthranilate synthase